MGQHGLINWADDDKACYELTLDLIERAAHFIEKNDKGDEDLRRREVRRHRRRRPARTVLIASCPGCAASSAGKRASIGTVQDDAAILRFVNSDDAPRLAELGTSCPDHFLRTKIKPLYVAWNPASRRPRSRCKKLLADGLRTVPRGLPAYYERCKHPDSPAMRDPNPTVDPDPRPRHDRLGQGQERIARDGRVLQLRRRGDARRRGDRRIRRAAAAGSVRHRVLAARRSEAQAHAAGEGTGPPGDRASIGAGSGIGREVAPRVAQGRRARRLRRS